MNIYIFFLSDLNKFTKYTISFKAPILSFPHLANLEQSRSGRYWKKIFTKKNQNRLKKTAVKKRRFWTLTKIKTMLLGQKSQFFHQISGSKTVLFPKADWKLKSIYTLWKIWY